MNAAVSPSPFLASVARAHARAVGGMSVDARTAALRRAALERFVAAGLPTGRDENWKYLSLRGLARREFDVAAIPATIPAASHRLPDGLLSLVGATRLIFVNGQFDAAWSTPRPKSMGTRIETLKETYARDPELVASALPVDDRADTRFALLNTAFATDGASIEIDAGESPLVYVVFIATGSANAAASFPRLRIRAAQGASATIVEHHIGHVDHVGNSSNGPGARFVNSLTEVEVGGAARVDLCRLHALGAQALQFDSLRARVGAGSTFAMHSLIVSGDIVRSDVDVALQAHSAATQLNGLLFTTGSQHHELHAEIRHAVAHTASRTHVRTVVNDTGRAACNSKVIVAPGARRSVSEQNFRNLLLANGAEADTRPQLEIYNEDVKCNHGATTGRLDPNMLFYLRSRGLDAATARSLLTYAFVTDLLQGLPLDELRRMLARRIAGELPRSDLIKDFI